MTPACAASRIAMTRIPSRRARRSAATGSRRTRRQSPPGAGPACSPRRRTCYRKSSPGWRRQGRLRSQTAPRRCPGATTANEVFFEAAIDWKLVMMPQTVPNRPTKGPAEPTVASTSSRRSKPLDLARDGDVHHLFDAHLQAGERARLALEAALPFAHGGDEQRRHRMRRARRQRAVEFLQRLARPERLLETVHRPAGAGVEQRSCRSRSPRPRPTQISSPTITVLTTQCACQNSANSDRSEEVSGSTDCATSAGFIGTSFRLNPVPRAVEPARRNIRSRRCARDDAAHAPTRPDVSRKSLRPVHRQAYEIPAKLGQTRARKRALPL